MRTESSLLLGCIADDFTGASDLASVLVASGLRVAQFIGIPAPLAELEQDVDAVVIALKTRTLPAADAVAQSLDALAWLRARHAHQVYFKYCSTFDSTSAGNIGPVIDALMDTLGTDFTVACPALPDNGRTVYQGHLFVGEALLSDSGMRQHPLTPMTDANLVRVLQAQTRRRVGLLGHAVLAKGVEAACERAATLRATGVHVAIVDAISNEDLMRLAPVVAGMPLVTGGSGLAMGLAGNFGVMPSMHAAALPPAQGARAIIAGSCSQATQRQVAHFVGRGGQALGLDPLRIAAGHSAVAETLAWAGPRLSDGPVLVYSSAEAGAVRAVQEVLGVQEAGALVEHCLAAISRGLVEQGVGRLVVAGGETSGACVQALEIERLRIGAAIDPGVPWCHASSPAARASGMHIALKSGNFGSDDFFTRAFEVLE